MRSCPGGMPRGQPQMTDREDFTNFPWLEVPGSVRGALQRLLVGD